MLANRSSSLDVSRTAPWDAARRDPPRDTNSPPQRSPDPSWNTSSARPSGLGGRPGLKGARPTAAETVAALKASIAAGEDPSASEDMGPPPAHGSSGTSPDIRQPSHSSDGSVASDATAASGDGAGATYAVCVATHAYTEIPLCVPCGATYAYNTASLVGPRMHITLSAMWGHAGIKHCQPCGATHAYATLSAMWGHACIYQWQPVVSCMHACSCCCCCSSACMRHQGSSAISMHLCNCTCIWAQQ